MVSGWHSVTSSVDNIRNALYSYGPVVATMYVYNDFYSYRSGIYSYSTGSYLGAHAVLVVGYDDTNQAFIVKNSWGTGWGEAGFFQIAYTEVGGTSRFGYSVLVYDGFKGAPMPPDTTPPSVTISSPANGSTVNKVVKIKVNAADGSMLNKMEAYVDGKLLGSAACTSSSCSGAFNWNANSSAKGSHTISAIAYDAALNQGKASISVTK